MKQDPKGERRQTASEYAAELRRWGRYSEEQIRAAVEYALAKGTILPDDAWPADGAPRMTGGRRH